MHEVVGGQRHKHHLLSDPEQMYGNRSRGGGYGNIFVEYKKTAIVQTN